MTKSRNSKICIVGIGNALRGDDGIAEFVCNKLNDNFRNSITVFITHQLDISWAEKIKNFDAVFFIDASIYDEDFFITEVNEQTQPQSSSHHINVAMLVQLTKQLYNVKTNFYVCGIKGYNFDYGFSISNKTMQNALQAIDLLSKKIISFSY